MTTLSVGRKYVRLVQMPNACTAACVQMVVERNGYGLIDQEDIAKAIGVGVAAENAVAFRSEMAVMTAVKSLGVSTMDIVPEINNFFRRRRIRIQGEAIRFRQISDFQKLVEGALRFDFDLQIEYHSEEVHPEDPVNQHIHDSLVETFRTEERIVSLVDPVGKRKQRIETNIDVLWRSIGPRFGKELGVVRYRRI